MNDKYGRRPIGDSSPRPGAPELGLGPGFWDDTPSLAWVEDERGRVFRLGDLGLCAGANVIATGGHFAHEVIPEFGSEALASLRQRRAVQAIEAGAPDGCQHHVLLVRIPVGQDAGAPLVVNISLDITRHQRHCDELVHQAVHDELTGLYNRRGFLLFAQHELGVARRQRAPSALVFVDIDNLKEVNDEHGHDAGNRLLTSTAVLLRHVFRDSDVIGRLGGDEFAVLASDVPPDPAQLRARFQAHLASWAPKTPAPLAMSVGVVPCGPAETRNLPELLADADRAMYQEKSAKAKARPAAQVAADKRNR